MPMVMLNVDANVDAAADAECATKANEINRYLCYVRSRNFTLASALALVFSFLGKSSRVSSCVA